MEFCFLGLFNTLSVAFFSWLADFFAQKNVAAVLGYVLSLSLNYILNCKYIFKNRISFRGYLRFWISYIPNFIIYFLVTFITINTLKLPQFVGTVLAAMAGGPITFVIIKLYAFNNKE
ncbi:MAG: GtrA family protein [Clostridia bacterium]|nr:GtrA family protein [Clostridia bacterium]